MAGSRYRQGDVLVVAVDRLPDGLKPVAREDGVVVLAHGEATGHRHAILEPHAELVAGRGERFLRIVGAPARLVHEEHDPIVLPAGTYQVVRQREYQPAALPRTRRGLSWCRADGGNHRTRGGRRRRRAGGPSCFPPSRQTARRPSRRSVSCTASAGSHRRCSSGPTRP